MRQLSAARKRRASFRVRLRAAGLAALVGLGTFIGFQVLLAAGWWSVHDTPFPMPPAAPQGDMSLQRPAAAPVDVPLNAQLVIPALGVRVPVVWSQSREEDALQLDLEQGAIHYPLTALPGSPGNSLITAHSSAPLWAKGAYKRAFAQLGSLQNGDTAYVVYTQGAKPVRAFAFRMTEQAIVSPTDPRLFQTSHAPTLTLVTCWPRGTNWRRLMVRLERTDVAGGIEALPPT